jgi:hypothetical protein
MQQLFTDEKGISTLRQFSCNTGLGYSKRVDRRTTALENDEERMDMGLAQLGFVAFDG